MAAMAFDTLKFARRLKDAGVPERQAEAEAEALAEVLEVNMAELVTRRDLADMDINLRREMRDMEARIETKIADAKFDLVKWIAGMLIAQAGLVAALVKLL